jgi:RNA polymerase sigma-70 factor (ECF subfamily)
VTDALAIVRRDEARTLDAFEALSDRCLDNCYRLATVVLRDPVEAEDVVHDAVLVAWQKFASLREPAHFEAWLGRIVLNLCRDRLRGRQRGRVREVRLGAALERNRRDEFAAVAERDAILSALATLDVDQQLVVSLRYYRDLPLEAIADLLDIPLGTVKSRLHAGLKHLRKAMEQAGWTEEVER